MSLNVTLFSIVLCFLVVGNPYCRIQGSTAMQPPKTQNPTPRKKNLLNPKALESLNSVPNYYNLLVCCGSMSLTAECLISLTVDFLGSLQKYVMIVLKHQTANPTPYTLHLTSQPPPLPEGRQGHCAARFGSLGLRVSRVWA